MKRYSTVVNCSLGFLALCVFLIRPVISDCISSFDPNEDYFTNKVDQQEGSAFLVTYYNSYKVVTNTRAGENYVLYCTVNPPNDTNVPLDVKGFFQVPVKRVASLDQTTITFLELIGAQSSLLYVEDTSSITSPCLQQDDDTAIKNFDDSQLANVDVVFTNSTPQNGTKYVTISLDDKQSPLSKAEWVKFVSLFFDYESSGNGAYSAIEAAYSCNANNVANIQNRKTIAWVSYDFNSGLYIIDTNNYYFSLVKDAGANSPNITTGLINMATMQQTINDVYMVIDQTDFPPGNGTFENWQRLFGYYETSTSSPVPDFISYRRVYHHKKLLNTNGFEDWTEEAFARPDLVILDMIAIQYPTYLPSYKTTWLDNFSESDQPTVITGAACTENSFEYPTNSTCEPQNFTGSQANENGGSNVNTSGDSKLKSRAIVAIVLSVLAGSLGVAASIWLLLFARRKYEERFLELKDEPNVQMEKADVEKSKAVGNEVENKV